MDPILRFLRITGALIAALGIIAGPALIAASMYFFSKLNDFRENGTKTTGIVIAKYDNGVIGRGHALLLDLRYRVGGTSEERIAERVYPSYAVQHTLQIGQQTDIYYKAKGDRSDILVAADYDPQNIPVPYKPYTGWIITLYSIGFILARQLYKRYKIKQHERHA
jgi:hypothetical protein